MALDAITRIRACVAQPLAELLLALLVRLPGGHFTPPDCPAEVAEALRARLASPLTDR